MKKKLADVLPHLDLLFRNSELSANKLDDVVVGIATEYARLSTQISHGEAWRWSKLEDSALAARFVDQLGATHALSDKLTSSLEVIAFGADIGRLILRVEEIKTGARRDQLTHGAISATFMDDLVAGRMKHEPLWRSLLTAVERHSDIHNPTLKEVAGDEVALLLSELLRDIDMYGNWLTGQMYLEKEKMRREMEKWGLTNEPYIPDRAIATFLKGEPVVRAEVETYAGYMLQFLAWRYNFTYEELWSSVLETKNPHAILAFIRNQLQSGNGQSQWSAIERQARKNLGISL